MVTLRTVSYALSYLLLIMAAALLLPALLGLADGDDTFTPFALTALGAGIVGGSMLWWGLGTTDHPKKAVFPIVVIGAAIALLVSALPYLLWKPGIIDAIFESTSGWTTTGATIFREVDTLPDSILLWRAITQWLGGLSILLIALVMLPYVEGERVSMLRPDSREQYKPRVRDVGRDMFILYLCFTGLNIILLFLGGVDLLDSICTAFSTMSTGGFTTRNAALPEGSGLYVELVTILFMLIAATNFLLHIRIFQGEVLPHWKSRLFKTFLAVTGIVTALVTADLLIHDQETGFWTALRRSLFESVSFSTTTGFRGSGADAWSQHARTVFLLIIFVGGMVGSTAGGIKLQRWFIVVRASLREILRLTHPNRVVRVWIEGQLVETAAVSKFIMLVTAWAALFVLGALILLANGLDLGESVFVSASAINNVGASFGTTGATWAGLTPIAKVSMILLMVLGRLEIFTLVAACAPYVWRSPLQPR